MKRAYMVLSLCLIVLGLVSSGCMITVNSDSCSTARLEKNKAIVRRCFEETDKENWAIFNELLVPDYIWHQAGRPKPLTREETEQFMRSLRAAFPDGRVTIEDMIAEGDKVVTRYNSRGTHKGDFMGIPATGKKVAVTGIVISRIAKGKIAEEWEEFDALGFMVQLGAIPPIEEAGKK
jgi:steroid delta-isomerase-like uncharacterized protein